MSRNFELLQQIGGMLEVPASAEEVTEPLSMPPVETGPSTPALEVAGKVRDEIAKLVLNLFLLPGAQRVVGKSFLRAWSRELDAPGCAPASLKSWHLRFADRSALWTATCALPVCINNLQWTTISGCRMRCFALIPCTSMYASYQGRIYGF